MSDMFLDLSKVLFGSFVLGPFLTSAGKEYNYALVSAGVLCSTILWLGGIVLAKPSGG